MSVAASFALLSAPLFSPLSILAENSHFVTTESIVRSLYAIIEKLITGIAPTESMKENKYQLQDEESIQGQIIGEYYEIHHHFYSSDEGPRHTVLPEQVIREQEP